MHVQPFSPETGIFEIDFRIISLRTSWDAKVPEEKERLEPWRKVVSEWKKVLCVDRASQCDVPRSRPWSLCGQRCGHACCACCSASGRCDRGTHVTTPVSWLTCCCRHMTPVVAGLQSCVTTLEKIARFQHGGVLPRTSFSHPPSPLTFIPLIQESWQIPDWCSSAALVHEKTGLEFRVQLVFSCVTGSCVICQELITFRSLQLKWSAWGSLLCNSLSCCVLRNHSGDQKSCLCEFRSAFTAVKTDYQWTASPDQTLPLCYAVKHANDDSGLRVTRPVRVSVDEDQVENQQRDQLTAAWNFGILQTGILRWSGQANLFWLWLWQKCISFWKKNSQRKGVHVSWDIVLWALCMITVSRLRYFGAWRCAISAPGLLSDLCGLSSIWCPIKNRSGKIWTFVFLHWILENLHKSRSKTDLRADRQIRRALVSGEAQREPGPLPSKQLVCSFHALLCNLTQTIMFWVKMFWFSVSPLPEQTPNAGEFWWPLRCPKSNGNRRVSWCGPCWDWTVAAIRLLSSELPLQWNVLSVLAKNKAFWGKRSRTWMWVEVKNNTTEVPVKGIYIW